MDFGRCGQPFNHQQELLSAAEVAMQAGQRLLAAVALGDAVQVMRCVANGADPNFEDPSTGETAICRAAQISQLAVVGVLVSMGADIERSDRAGRTPLYFAASSGHVDIVKELLFHGASLFPHTKSTASTSVDRHPSANEGNTQSSPCSAPDVDEASLLALRDTCPLAAAAAAGHWPVVPTLLTALPPDYQRHPPVLRSLRFLVWSLASHHAFPREVIAALPPRLPRCVIDAVRPAHLASTPLVLATGNDQQQLMQWLLQQGADPELGAPLLLCAGRFCRGSRTCCVSTLLRRGARPHVAWADNPSNSPLRLAAMGDCFSHVHCLVAYGADVDGEAARVRQALYTAAPWEAHLDVLMQQYSDLAAAPGAGLLCPCGQQHARWPGLWPSECEADAEELEGMDKGRSGEEQEAGACSNSCHNRTPADDAWYRRHCTEMEQLQDGNELAECRKAVDELWLYGCSAVISELGGVPSAPHSLMPQRILATLQDVAGSWLMAAARCRQQRQLRADLYDKAVAAGRALLDRKRVAALMALSGASGGGGGGGGGSNAGSAEGRADAVAPTTAAPSAEDDGVADAPQVLPPSQQHQQQYQRCSRQPEGLVKELKQEILALAGLAPFGIEPSAVSLPGRAPCSCLSCCGK
ncbi:hypothetical protein VOLCADRAFT_89676 [Volvox carteri f. nagariensis]|uniref:Uncharacterized protein n=1 Tax=Volvox carteri f. nagariensis TaxID=3068 RepID=D8TRS6_VOLCA|nr:uncharacterized protein VOLCADRAFT_89676 [Volvox carteri f. nagariensis]EFJ49695.1 hypothetical protein VOLCADRAFT_89676 [Volvox carteri f. nagariensis]|eukprot:XP_002949202.1 hypothetical protein VOLCADRAFT_89676 [Volvox carteri f. nagariensis]